MFRFDDWWMPDGETHLPKIMARHDRRVKGRLTYQFHKYEGALAHCRSRRVAVDVGAHIGLWSYWMARHFDRLCAFEPNGTARACWEQNVPVSASRTLYPYALGATAAGVGLVTTTIRSSGNTNVIPGGAGVEMRTLDSFEVPDLDLLKVDCEGYELFVLQGAVTTITRWKPVVVVEQKHGFASQYGCAPDAAVTFLQGMGYAVQWVTGGDYCLTAQES